MPDIFGNQTAYGGSFRANQAALTFSLTDGNTGGLGLLVQDVQGMYEQAVTRLFEIGPDNRTYFIVGRAQGQFGMTRVIGPFAVQTTFVTEYANPCNTDKNKITIASLDQGCASGVGSLPGYGFENCLLNRIGIATDAGSMVFREQTSVQFAAMTN
jgi:hypothetical protein